MKAMIAVMARRTVRIAAGAATLGLVLAAAAPPSVAAPCGVARSALNQRVYDHASRGTDVLRSFTVRTRNTYGLDLQEENNRYARESAAERACLQVQAAEATPTPAAAGPAAAVPIDTASR